MKYVLILLIFCLGCGQTPIVKRVISCDTIELDNGEIVRYAGIEGPKSGEWFDYAREANAYLVANKSVQYIAESHQKNGEIIAFVYTPVIEKGKKRYLFVNAELVRFGFARALPMPVNCRNPKLWQNLIKLYQERQKQ